MNKLLETKLKEYLQNRTQITLFVKGTLPIYGFVITEITRTSVSGVAPAFNEMENTTQLHQFTFCRSMIGGVSVCVASIPLEEEDFDDFI